MALLLYTLTSLLLATDLVTTHLLELRQIHDTTTTTASPGNNNTIIVKDGDSPLPASVVPQDPTVLTSSSLPGISLMPEVGNGHVATVVHSNTIFMNGLYNGANITSHRARIPSTADYSISFVTLPGLNRTYTLDMGRGVFTESHTNGNVSVALRTYAHRKFTSTLVTELVITRSDVSTDFLVNVYLNVGPVSDDVALLDTEPGLGLVHAATLEAEFPDVAPTTDFYIRTSPSLQGSIRLEPGKLSQTYLALTSIHVFRDVVIAEYDQALQSFQDGTLLSTHVEEWNKIWSRGRIDVEGDLNVARQNYAGLYYILSSLPFNGNNQAWPFIGLSPGGLAHGLKGRDYYGHVFWDQDIWMFPPIALLYPDLGRLLVETRTKTLNSAKRWAQETGWEGARFPWESCFTGLETCPAEDPLKYQIHISGDVSMMVRQYWQLTRDRELMVNGSGAELVWETAKYWASRVTYNQDDDTYRINGVMPPDEWHSPVNDSAYTNNIAAITLTLANQLAREFGQAANSTWTEISNKLYLPYDPVLDYHPEYEGYITNVQVKQADVVLLGFPLMVDMDPSTRANDMVIYEQATPIGPAPAMTWGMFLLGWLELGNETKAAELFTRSVLNAQDPFLVWTENSNGDGATNFITGMGGYLQSVLFGYGGARLYDDRLSFYPKLIAGTTRVTFTGLNYRGCSFDLDYTASSMTLTLTSIDQGQRSLDVKFNDKSVWEQMIPGQNIVMSRQSFIIRSSQ